MWRQREGRGWLAFLDVDGSIGMGLTVITTPGVTPLHLDVRVSASSVSGTWRDSSGQSSVWAFSPGPLPGGGPRPISSVVFPGGVSAGGAAVTNVGPPSLSTDAATKGYVDVGNAADRAYALSVATAAVPLGAAAAVVQSGSVATTTTGCRGFFSAGSIMMDLPVRVGGSITGIIVRYLTANSTPPETKMTSRIVAMEENDFTIFDDTEILVFQSSILPGFAGAYRNDSRPVSAAPVSLTRRYVLQVISQAPDTTSDQMIFCGATVLYSMP